MLEYVEHGSLEDVLGDKRGASPGVSSAVKVAMAADAACGILQVHAAGLVHRDIAARYVPGVARRRLAQSTRHAH